MKLIMTPEQEAKVRQDIVDSVHRTFDARSYGERCFPTFLAECFRNRVWEQIRIFESGTRQNPIPFDEFIRRPYPVGLGTTHEEIERVIAGDESLLAAWREASGRTVSPTTSVDALDENASLAACEAIIEKGLRTFVEVGRALAKIRDDGLYSEGGHKTFEAYCKARWQMGKSRAYQLIEGAEVSSTIVDSGLPAPTREAQTRELAKLPAEEQAPAWKEAVETAPAGKVTARHVAKVVQARIEPEPEPAKSTKPEPPIEPARTPAVVVLSAVDSALALVSSMTSLERAAFISELHELPVERLDLLDFDPDIAIEEPDGAFERMMLAWPRAASLAPVVRWLKTKLGMTEQEAARWSTPTTSPSFVEAPVESVEEALTRLAAQRAEHAELVQLRHIQMGVGTAFCSRAQRMIDLVLDGGELALIRLGLDWTVTTESLQRAFKSTAKTEHPDQGGSAERFRRLVSDRDLIALFLAEPQARPQ